MEYLIHLAILVSIFAILAISLDLIAGYTGLVSVCHAAFWGIGAYTSALLMNLVGVNLFIALFSGALLSAGVALFTGLVFSRLREDYYVLGTLAFNYIVFTVFLNWNSLTGGPLGVPGIPRPELFGFLFSSNFSFLLLSFAALLAVYSFARFIVRSPFGRVLKAIREDDKAVSIFGYRTIYFKLMIFVIGAALAAVGGGLLASYVSFIDPNSFGVAESIFVLSIIILGGLGSLRGALVGAFILVLLPEALRFVGFTPDSAGQMRQVIYGLLLVTLMLYRPQGLVGEYKL